MKIKALTGCLIYGLALGTGSAWAGPNPVSFVKHRTLDRLYFGGGVGAGFGDVDFVEVAPLVGFQVTNRISTGVGVLYRWRNDSRSSPDLTTTDYGSNVFTRVSFIGPLFLGAEYEYLTYEYRDSTGGKTRDRVSSVLAGPGVSWRTGGHSAFYAQALYNLSYDNNDPTSAYDNPWVYRTGVTFAF
jgi:hypothetical protein